MNCLRPKERLHYTVREGQLLLEPRGNVTSVSAVTHNADAGI